jgi:flavin reductase (DIM6/NTAB) family NADH-FMN oxidoreductase RutF
MAHWASGVTVVTSTYGGEPVGITASSFASVSLQPPQVLVCVARRLYTHGVIEKSRIFAVNILGVEHLEWGMRFAGLIPEIVDRFQGIECNVAATGCPILPGILGWLDCTLSHAYDGGDHTIFVGEIVACAARADGAPILYYNRHWRRLDDQILTLN